MIRYVDWGNGDDFSALIKMQRNADGSFTMLDARTFKGEEGRRVLEREMLRSRLETELGKMLQHVNATGGGTCRSADAAIAALQGSLELLTIVEGLERRFAGLQQQPGQMLRHDIESACDALNRAAWEARRENEEGPFFLVTMCGKQAMEIRASYKGRGGTVDPRVTQSEEVTRASRALISMIERSTEPVLLMVQDQEFGGYRCHRIAAKFDIKVRTS